MDLKIIWLKGKNGVGKTNQIRKMLGYEEETYYKYTPNTPERYSLDNIKFKVLKINYKNLIVRFFLKNRCKICSEIEKLNKTISEQKKRIDEKETNFFRAMEFEKLIKKENNKIEECNREIKSFASEMEIIKSKSKIDLSEISPYTSEELEESNWYEYYDLSVKIKKIEEEIEVFNRFINQYSQEMKTLNDKRGFSKLKESYDFNSWKLYDSLIKHSLAHEIDIWITILSKEDLIPFFNIIEKMKINRLFIEKLIDFWLIAELTEKFKHYVSFNPPLKAYLKFPQNIDKLFIETNSLDDELIIEPQTITI